MSDLLEKTPIYFDPTTDYGFKKLFGEEVNKDLLMDFLNSMLPKIHEIKTLNFQKTEQLPDHQDDRKTVYDILCEDVNGEKFIVEMQKSRLTYMMDRSIYYTTFPIQTQAPKGKWDFNLTRVYLIGILDFHYDKNLDYWKERQLLRSFSLKDEKGVLMTDKLHYLFLQLPFFNKAAQELENQFDKWCYFLKNLEDFNNIPHILNEPIFMKAFDVAELSKMDKNDYILYQISKSKKYDMEVLIDEAKQQGREEVEIQTILRLYAKGYLPTQISDLLGILLEKVIEIVGQTSE